MQVNAVPAKTEVKKVEAPVASPVEAPAATPEQEAQARKDLRA